MTTVTRPRGPLPARVYWTRRLILVAVLLALVFGVAHLLGSGGGAGNGPSAQPVGAEVSATGTASATTATPTTLPASSAATGAGTASAAPTVLASPTGNCASNDIVATPTLKGDQAYAGRPVVFSMVLTTKTSAACSWTVSPDALAVKVTSGTDRIWSTQECTGAVPKQEVVVRKDVPTTVKVAWNGQRSDADCTRSTAWAEPGTYHAVAAAFGSDPVDERFALLTPTPRTITATPTPDARASRSAAAQQRAAAKKSASATKTPAAKQTSGPSPR